LLRNEGSKEVKPKRASRQKKKPTYVEGESEVPGTDDSSLPKHQHHSQQLSAILVFYNSLLKSALDDPTVS
jgi:hypothetical protein